MNKIKTIIRAVALIAVVSASTGCLDNFEDYNRNPNEATDDELERDNYLVGSKLTKLQNMVIPSEEHLYQFVEALEGGSYGGYVEATVDGKITRGFVPQRDVVFDDVELPDEEAKLVGSWQMEAGGEFWDNYLRLDADGKFYGSDNDGAQPYHGTWSVVQTPADSNLYWRGDIPTIVFRCVNGTVYRYGVEVSDDYEVTEGSYCRSMSFITCEGGTGYVSYGVYDESGSVITNENGKLILKELDVTDELNWGAYWEEEGNG